MPLPKDLDKARVDRATHERNRAVRAANASFSIDSALAENEQAMHKIRSASVLDRVFPVDEEDVADYDRAEQAVSERFVGTGFGPETVAGQMQMDALGSDSPTRRFHYNLTQDLANVNSYRREARSAGKEVPDADLDAERMGQRIDELYAQTHRQTGAQSQFFAQDRDLLVDQDLRDESERAASSNNRVDTFSALYGRGRPMNEEARRYQEDVTGVLFGPKLSFGEHAMAVPQSDD